MEIIQLKQDVIFFISVGDITTIEIQDEILSVILYLSWSSTRMCSHFKKILTNRYVLAFVLDF